MDESQTSVPIADGAVATMDENLTEHMSSKARTTGMLKSQEELMKLTDCLGLPTIFDVQFCSNTNCNTRTKAANLVEAPSFAVTYFGFPRNQKRGPVRICRKCLRNAEEFDKASRSLLKKVGLNAKKAIVSQSGPYYSVNNLTLDHHLAQLMEKFNLKGQLKLCFQKNKEDVEALERDFSDVQKQMEKTSDEISNVKSAFNLKAGPTTRYVEMGSVDINVDDSYVVTEMESLTEELKHIDVAGVPQEVADFRKTVTSSSLAFTNTLLQTSKKKSRNVRKCQSQVQSSSNNTCEVGKHSRKSCAANTAYEAVQWSAFKFRPPVKNQMVYAMYGDMKSFWTPGKVVEVEPAPGSNGKKACVFIELFRASRTARSFSGKHVAFRKSTLDRLLPVGTRVISKFKDLLMNNPGFNGKYFAGIVAEAPELQNDNRYLIFYDDGFVQYVDAADVLPVVESSKDVWDDVDVDYKDFIRDYLINYPCNRVFEAKVGHRCSVEYNGSWLQVTVVEVDCSLIRIQYSKKSGVSEEWLYIGSTRIKNIFDMKHKANRESGHFRSSVPGTNNVSNVTQVIRDYEVAGQTIDVGIPPVAPLPKAYLPHDCSPICCELRYVEEDFRGLTSPLVIPFYLGWARKLSETNKNLIVYASPCGLKLNSYEDVLNYNKLTKNEIPIEFFTFESNVHCLSIFHPTHKTHFIKEWTPIQFVNSIDQQPPCSLEYRSNRVIGESVKIDPDEGFLVCCDCEDDCRDKSKCACWKLTMEGVSFKSTEKGGPCTGYENRRLKEVVASGIYECNRRCKCNVKTCLNRVVQNKVMWPIQIFRTVQKGWGARTLHDIPAGSFICLYSGKLMNDTQGNQEGLIYGDEYFADLDFIESLESMKAGYQDDCTDIENSDTEDAVVKKKPKLNGATVPVARKSTTGAHMTGTKNNATQRAVAKSKSSSFRDKPISYRKYFGNDESPYIMDGKREGNIGRFFNHSCDPNLFIQNVFVDTQDLRFPWLAFFTNKVIKAGTELCWDYNYEVGSVAKTLTCYCGAGNCRGRLL
ncbi:Histone-lysine N-methyltransferase eggless [Orchesella cincta]|uniref:Histone-lysine N-methyltransferase eggless n=1 Tax=Orchesella cincta TaxID=48709 RepID=A0A1D2MW35_ORCCI|nr:Histone-lysine N-methyltransferase eggless [Orchesella cincta]